MPLDFTIATSLKIAQRSSPILAIGAFDHEALFTEIAPAGPFLSRMNDFYKDALFHHGELTDVQSEIRSALGRLDEGSPSHSLLEEFLGICAKAEAAQANIYVFCD